MTRDEKKRHLLNLKRIYDKTNDIWQGLDFAHGGNPESTLFRNISDVQELALKFVQVLIDDEYDYLSWFIYDNGWGENRLTVKIDDGPERVITNYDDILNVIEDLQE